eukprot:GFUD01107822.1.p1 GENE.GFUD01107822.1~~GFUD01107822.1.p1  ORF type:complete len:117 (+),score=12.13 GFUD01107822.1:558-908(+)
MCYEVSKRSQVDKFYPREVVTNLMPGECTGILPIIGMLVTHSQGWTSTDGQTYSYYTTTAACKPYPTCGMTRVWVVTAAMLCSDVPAYKWSVPATPLPSHQPRASGKATSLEPTLL